MILIISDKFDSTTCEVIDWLISKKMEFVRVNDEDKIEFVQLNNRNQTDFELVIDNKTIKLSKVLGYWFRRGYLNIFPNTDELASLPDDINKRLKAHLIRENETLRDYLYSLLSAKKGIGSPLTDRINKLICLQKAKELGLLVPDTSVLTRRSDIELLLNTNEVITKGVQDVTYFTYKTDYVANYTEQVTDEVLQDLSEKKFPSLFQEKLDKQYEIRTFYLLGKFYSMCIFSQLDSRTSVDFRKYNTKKPNRVVPYQLPEHIETALHNLMRFFNLKTGSIDLVFTKCKRYYFLEVNPVGQFGMVSYPCNYQLEKKVANALAEE